MSVLSPIDGGRVRFLCPGCQEQHTVSVSRPGAFWGWNGDSERPTFTPSVFMKSGHYCSGQQGKRCWCDYNREQIEAGKRPSGFTCHQCHSFVTDGRIQFLNDSTHALAGQTVALPPFPGANA